MLEKFLKKDQILVEFQNSYWPPRTSHIIVTQKKLACLIHVTISIWRQSWEKMEEITEYILSGKTMKEKASCHANWNCSSWCKRIYQIFRHFKLSGLATTNLTKKWQFVDWHTFYNNTSMILWSLMRTCIIGVNT